MARRGDAQRGVDGHSGYWSARRRHTWLYRYGVQRGKGRPRMVVLGCRDLAASNRCNAHPEPWGVTTAAGMPMRGNSDERRAASALVGRKTYAIDEDRRSAHLRNSGCRRLPLGTATQHTTDAAPNGSRSLMGVVHHTQGLDRPNPPTGHFSGGGCNSPDRFPPGTRPRR
jgi:hypothetical protein